MTVRIKRRYRLVVLLLCFSAVTVVGTGSYVWRKSQIHSQAMSKRIQGMASFESGDYFQAMHNLGSYLRRYPDDADATYRYAQARLRVKVPGGKHLVQTIGVLRHLLTLQPDHPTGRRALLKLYTQVGYRTETLDTAEVLLKEDPDDVEAVRAKVDALISLRELDKVLAFADQVLSDDVGGQPRRIEKVRAEAARAKAIALRVKDRLDEALASSQQYNQWVPLDVEGHLLTFQILLDLQRPRQELVERAMELLGQHQGDPRFELLQAVAYRAAGDQENAVKWLRLVSKRKPTDETLVKKLVSELDSIELFGEATSVLESAAQQIDDPGFRRMLVYRLIQMGRVKQADELLAQAGLDPHRPDSDSELLGLYVMVLYQLERKENAQGIVDALAARSNDRIAQAWAQFHSEVTFGDQPDPSSVIQVCQKAVSRHPQNAFILHTMGQTYASMGETDLAIDAWNKASQHAPVWFLPRMRMARALLGTPQRQLAVPAAQAAINRAPNNAEAAITLVVAGGANLDRIDKKDKLDDLLSMANKIQEVLPGEEQTLPIQILLLARTGQPDAARVTLRAVLEAQSPPSGQTLLRLASVSRQAGLGLEEACLKLSQETENLTPKVAYGQAIWLLTDGQPEAGFAWLETASKKSGSVSSSAWRLAMARYLDAMQDSRARAAWVALGDQMPQDIQVQRLVLASRSAWADRDFIDRTIDRLRGLTSDDGLGWRVARARWMIGGSKGQADLAKAADLLDQVIRVAPQLVEARLLIAQCYDKLENRSAAIEQLSRAAQLTPNNHGITLDLARLLQDRGDDAAASAQISRVTQSGSGASDDNIRRAAQLLVRQGDGDGAIAVLEPLYERMGGDGQTGLLLARLYEERHQTDKAREICQKLLEKPTVAVVEFAANFYGSQDRQDLAQEALALLDELELAPGVRESVTGEYYARFVGPEKATEQYEAATRADPANPAVWRRLIAYRMTVGQSVEAVRSAQEALGSVADDEGLKSVVEHADLLSLSDKNPLLRPIVLGLLEDSDTRSAAIEALRIMNDCEAQDRSVDARVAAMQQLANRHTTVLALQNLAAQLLITAGQQDDAVVISARAMQAFPNAYEPVRLAAEALAGLDRWDEAMAMAQRMRRRWAKDPIGSDLIIAEAKLRAGEIQGGSAQLAPYVDRAMGQPFIYVQVIVNYARSLIAAGETDKAAEWLAPLLDQSPMWRSVWMRLALSAVDDSGVSAAWLERVGDRIPVDRFDERASLVKGWEALSERSKRPEYRDRARDMIDALVQEPDVTASCWLIHAMMAEDDGRLDVAAVGYRKAIERDPQLHTAKNNLAMILVGEVTNLDEARRLALEAVQAQPRNANYRDTLAWVHAKAKDYPAAIASMRMAIQLDPGNRLWQQNLGRVLDQAGRPSDGQGRAQNTNEPVSVMK